MATWLTRKISLPSLVIIAIAPLVVLGLGYYMWWEWPKVVGGLMPDKFEGQLLGPFGDSYGPLSSLFSLLTFVIVVFSLAFQMWENHDLRKKENEEKKAADDRRKQEEERAIALAEIQREIATANAVTAKLSAIRARIAAYDQQISDLAGRLSLSPRKIPLGNEPPPEKMDGDEKRLNDATRERRNLYLLLDKVLEELGLDKREPATSTPNRT